MDWGRRVVNNIEKQIEFKKMVAEAFNKATEEIQQAISEKENFQNESARYYFDVNKGEYRIMTFGQSFNYSFDDIKVALREVVRSDNTNNFPDSSVIMFGNIVQDQIDGAVRKLIYKDLVDKDII